MSLSFYLLLRARVLFYHAELLLRPPLVSFRCTVFNQCILRCMIRSSREGLIGRALRLSESRSSESVNRGTLSLTFVLVRLRKELVKLCAAVNTVTIANCRDGRGGNVPFFAVLRW